MAAFVAESGAAMAAYVGLFDMMLLSIECYVMQREGVQVDLK